MAPTSCAICPVVQSRASIRWSPASARMPPPATLASNRQVLSFRQGGQPGPGEKRGHQPHRADRAGGESAPGFDQARAKAKLMPDADLEIAPAGQADDVGRLLHVGRQRLLDEHMATRLERIHGQPVVRQMGREDRQRMRGLLRGAARDGRRRPATAA